MNDRQKQFEQDLSGFPETVRALLRLIPQQAGMLSFEQCETTLEQLGISLEDLMVRLLPMAKHYARVPISNFRVGAVAKVFSKAGADQYNLYLGANIEFADLVLNQSVHAEQAVTMNAWMRGAVKLETLAVSAMPCGHCRQFLYEFEAGDTIRILVPSGENGHIGIKLLPELLPEAFGPHDLAIESGLMAISDEQRELSLESDSEDPMILAALSAAEKSYSPYTENYAGAAIETIDGNIYSGRYVENAAFNPSLSPLHTAVISMVMDEPFQNRTITRAVLVEKPTAISQRDFTQLLLKGLAPDVRLEYFNVLH